MTKEQRLEKLDWLLMMAENGWDVHRIPSSEEVLIPTLKICRECIKNDMKVPQDYTANMSNYDRSIALEVIAAST